MSPRWLRRLQLDDPDLPIWYDPEYRLPLSAFNRDAGVEARRADLAAWYLLEWRWIERSNLRAPSRVTYEEMSRVHTATYLESLGTRETLAEIFGADPLDVPVDEVMRAVRLACGGTLAAARQAITRQAPAVNLLGGFHHAAPSHGAGLCALNDIAIAVAALRSESVGGQIAVLDLDAHQPDGTALCLNDDAGTWIGSISGAAVRRYDRVDEIILPPRAGDGEYMAALELLLERMPEPDVAFVIAGGDVVADDHLGLLGLSLDGARARDIRVARRLKRVPSVWLPGGGYHRRAWQALAGTVLAVLDLSTAQIEPGEDPLAVRFARLARRLERDAGEADLDLADLETEFMDRGRSGRRLFLGGVTGEAVEFALFRFGLLAFLERRGFTQFRVDLSTATSGADRVSLYGRLGGEEFLLLDQVMERRRIGDDEVLYVHWVSAQDPRRRFGRRRPRLPGQEAPGLGLGREILELLIIIARRLHLAGVAFTPAHYHIAFIVRARFRFIDPVAQGRFLAAVRDLGRLSLATVSAAFAEGRVRLNGEPAAWEPSEMAYWLDDRPIDEGGVKAERERAHFTIVPARAEAGGRAPE